MADDARQVVEELLADFSTGNIDGVLARLHPDLVVHEPASLPYGGEHRGPQGFAALMRAMGTAYEVAILQATVSDAGDGQAVARIDCRLRSRESGQAMDLPVVELYRLRDGLIAGLDVFPKDTAAMLKLHARSEALAGGR